MAVGLNPSKNEIDSTAGVIAREIQTAINRVVAFKYFLDGKTDAELVAIGYTPEEVVLLRAAYTDLYKLAGVYAGASTQLVAKDFRDTTRKIFGLGAL